MSESQDVDLTIRPAELGDAESLGNLMGELGYPTRTTEMQMRLETILPDSHYQTFVAVSGGKIRGMIACVCQASYEHNDIGGRILALVVAEKMRGHGVGRTLIAAAENYFATKNIIRISVNTRLTRKETHAFYEGVGYTATGYRFVKTLTPAD